LSTTVVCKLFILPLLITLSSESDNILPTTTIHIICYVSLITAVAQDQYVFLVGINAKDVVDKISNNYKDLFSTDLRAVLQSPIKISIANQRSDCLILKTFIQHIEQKRKRNEIIQ
jgi:hypothetical protein